MPDYYLTTDEKYMHRCLQLAGLGAGTVAPNPMVGAVLVYNDKIIGEGYHKKYGEAHAEVNCINSVSQKNRRLLPEATLYVSLEPCAHYGQTPPCADLIIKCNIAKVVVGCRDIFKEVDGKGIQKLREAGAQVITGVLDNECREFNKRFFSFHQQKRPYVILKWAQSLDGKIGSSSGNRILISNEYTNRAVHKWRSQEAAVMVATNTALYDDPSLTARLWNATNTSRIIIDTNLRLPHRLKIFNKEVKTIIINKIRMAEEGNLSYYKTGPVNDLPEIMQALFTMNIQSVLVEGGGMLLQSFIDAGLWDEARVICNGQLIIGDGLNAPNLKGSVLQEKKLYLEDSIACFKPLR